MKIDENDRVMIAKHESRNNWQIISNPQSGYFEKAMSSILNNAINEYVEYKNCGMQTRMVRVKSLDDYGIKTKELSDCAVLTRENLLPEGKEKS